MKKDETKTRTLLVKINIISLIIIIAALLQGCIIIKTIYSLNSPGGEYQLSIYQYVVQPAEHGLAKCRINLKKNINIISQSEVSIMTDGRSADNTMFQVEWFDDFAEVWVYKGNSSDEIYRLYFNGGTEQSLYWISELDGAFQEQSNMCILQIDNGKFTKISTGKTETGKVEIRRKRIWLYFPDGSAEGYNYISDQDRLERFDPQSEDAVVLTKVND